MTKADIWLISAIMIIALIILLVFRMTRTQGSYANISYDGVIIMQIPLSQSEDKYYLLTESMPSSNEETQLIYGIEELSEEKWLDIQHSIEDYLEGCLENYSKYYNVFLCQNGEVRMVESSCPDQICVHHSAISATGENIICLPHKVVIEIVGDKGQERELDGVAY